MGNRREFFLPLVILLFGFTTSSRLALPSSTCSADTTLCFGGRFQVVASWTAPDGSSGSGHAVSLTPDTGYFWFLDATNIEVAIKLLDGCSVNDHL